MKKNKRLQLLEWAEQGYIDPAHLPEALRASGVTPSASEWRSFLDNLLLWLGALLTASGVIFFFAYNWDALSRFTRFALVESVLLLSLLAVWRLGVTHLAGKVALLLAAIFVGALLALVGQTYQTGADTYELFAVWCVLILPWALLARFDALWMLWLLLLNVSIVLYYQTFGGLFYVMLGVEQLLWALFVVNTLALLVWEWLLARGAALYRSVRWMTRLLATVSGALVGALAVLAIVGSDDWISWLGLPVWCLWMVCAYYWYRKVDVDVYALAIGVLSAIAVFNVALGRLMFEEVDVDGALGLLVISFSVIALSAKGALWLRDVVREEQS